METKQSTPLQEEILGEIAENGDATITELAMAFQVPRGRVYTAIRRLQESGLVHPEGVRMTGKRGRPATTYNV